MRVVVVLEARFERTPEGAVWTRTMFPHAFWERYLDVFDAVRVVARVRDVAEPGQGMRRVDGPKVSLAGVPNYTGPWEYLFNARAIRQAVRSALDPEDAVILRVGSQLAACVTPFLQTTGRPYGVEVVTDPYDVFGPGTMRHPLRPFFRWLFPRRLRSQCARAAAAAYVTREALQRRYPPGTHAFSVGCSDVELPAAAFTAAPRGAVRKSGPFTALFVGSLAQVYKAPDVLLDAAALAIGKRTDLQLVIAGDGKHRSELEGRVRWLGIADRVSFLGELPAGEVVRAQFDRADLFVLPSRCEGLPRVLVEAMARGLPCVATTVGGIPELLPPEDLVSPGRAGELAAKFCEMLADPGRRVSASMRNWERAHAYRDEALQPLRHAFFQAVRAATAGCSQGGLFACRAC